MCLVLMCCNTHLISTSYLFLMTSHLNSHRTTDIKPEMLSGVQTGNGTPHDKYNIRGIAHARTNRIDDIFMQSQLVQNLTFILKWGQGTCSLTKHPLRWTYSACCLVRFAPFLSVRCILHTGIVTVNNLFLFVKLNLPPASALLNRLS